jgi:hypothetical protein
MLQRINNAVRKQLNFTHIIKNKIRNEGSTFRPQTLSQHLCIALTAVTTLHMIFLVHLCYICSY